MDSDGDIDYSRYDLDELRQAEASISRTQYPRNYANLMAAIESREDEAARAQAECGSEDEVSGCRQAMFRTLAAFAGIVLLFALTVPLFMGLEDTLGVESVCRSVLIIVIGGVLALIMLDYAISGGTDGRGGSRLLGWIGVWFFEGTFGWGHYLAFALLVGLFVLSPIIFEYEGDRLTGPAGVVPRLVLVLLMLVYSYWRTK